MLLLMGLLIAVSGQYSPCSNPRCGSCFAPNSQTCTTCSANYTVFYNLDCYNQTCPTAPNCTYVGTITYEGVLTTYAQLNPAPNCSSVPYCITCDQTTETCTQCAPTYYLNTTTKRCQPCDDTCFTCSGPGTTKCVTCVNNKYIDTTTWSCVSTCPNATLAVNSTYSCDACASGCAECSGTTANCVVCKAGYYMYENTCVATCPLGTYANNTTMSCLACSSVCVGCNGPANTQCTACKPTEYLYQGRCLTTFPLDGCVNNMILRDCVNHCENFAGKPDQYCEDLACLTYCVNKQHCIDPDYEGYCTLFSLENDCDVDCSDASSLTSSKSVWMAITLLCLLFFSKF